MKIELTKVEQILLSELLWREHIQMFDSDGLTAKELEEYQDLLVGLGDKIRGTNGQ